jgi:uncharacterized membrane protein (UPF0127 family)
MRIGLRTAAWLLAALALPPAAAARAERCPPPAAYHAPQPTLPREKLLIVGRDGATHGFEVEMALTETQQEIGLMARTAVPPDGGMLFDMGLPPEVQRFWMCNTFVPLDMVFIRPDGTIDSIAQNAVPRSLDTVASEGPVRAVLELAGGTAARLGIRPGDRVRQRIFGNMPEAR